MHDENSIPTYRNTFIKVRILYGGYFGTEIIQLQWKKKPEIENQKKNEY